MLVFLPGELAIKDCLQRLAELDPDEELALLPLYARLSHEDQDRVFLAFPGQAQGDHRHQHRRDERHHRRGGARDRLGPGEDQLLQPEDLHRVPRGGARLEGLLQPAPGPGGPHGPGVCYRLYSRADYEARPMYTTEEILRTDLSEVVLRMAELGIRDFESFDFLSPRRARTASWRPSRPCACSTRWTTSGPSRRPARMMCRFPILPKHARMIVEAIRAYPSVHRRGASSRPPSSR